MDPESLLLQHFKMRPRTTLYHYTTAAGIYGIVTDKALRATQLQYLNDSSEFMHGLAIARETCRYFLREAHPEDRIAFLKDLLQSLDSWDTGARTFVFSFTEEGDSLAQWRAYCSQGGHSLGFDPELVFSLGQKGGWSLLPCVYDVSKQERLFEDLVRRTMHEFDAHKALVHSKDTPQLYAIRFQYDAFRLAASMKNAAFAEEKEWRLIGGPFPPGPASCWYVRGTLLVPGHKLKVDALAFVEIITGPSRDQRLAYDPLFGFCGWHGVEVRSHKSSHIPFRPLGS